ncbi:hypothetical protein [Tahibacter amnicola]|uniref:ELWxxDGT repeat protein n=1 Tax=Tahibacter amnicola TaxID=2976241 RepID=A0ABY6BC92_9GAMM|nr:hypothetical protein [Tahibacter amnicola]UXI66793.1 hypothetical protein N4264_18840 [Tahibacter amnicola]
MGEGYRILQKGLSGMPMILKVIVATALAAGAVSESDALPPVRASLVKDIETAPGVASSDPGHFISIGDRAYFVATTPETGTELYSTDGSPAGLRLVRDFAAGPASSSAVPFGGTNGRIIVAANNGIHGMQMWSVNPDGTAATRLTSEPSAGDPWYVRAPLATTQNHVFVRMGNSAYSTDGTLQGTVKHVIPGASFLTEHGVCPIGDAIVTVTYEFGSVHLSRVDPGQVAQTDLALMANFHPEMVHVASAGDHCYVAASAGNGWVLWKTDGTAAGSRQIADSGNGRARGLAYAGGQVYVAESAQGRFRLVLADALRGQTTAVMDVPLNLGHHTVGMLPVGNRLAFFAPYQAASILRTGVFITDGTTAGTRRVLPDETGSAWVNHGEEGIVVGSHVYYHLGTTLWRVDPQSLSSEPVISDFPFLPRNSTVLNGKLIGAAKHRVPNQSTPDVEVYQSDLTVAGTQLLNDVWPSTAAGVLFESEPIAAARGDSLLFVQSTDPYASNSFAPANLWRTDGTEAGTYPLARSQFEGDWIDRVVPYGNDVLFETNSSYLSRIYRADWQLGAARRVWEGTATRHVLHATGAGNAMFRCGQQSYAFDLCGMSGGTDLPVVIFPRFGDYHRLTEIGRVNATAIFAGVGDNSGIWRSDATAPGTFRISALQADWWQQEQVASAVLNGRLFFLVCSGSGPCYFMSTDGSLAGTRTILEFPSGTTGQLTTVGGKVLFVISHGSTSQLWSSDGTAVGSVLVEQFSTAGAKIAEAGANKALVFACSESCEQNLTLTDGTFKGSYRVTLPTGFQAIPGNSAVLENGAVLFLCHSQRTGEELCVTAANAYNATLVRDIYPGTSGSSPLLIGQTDSAAFFTADDGYHGRELWKVEPVPEMIFRNGFEAD